MYMAPHNPRHRYVLSKMVIQVCIRKYTAPLSNPNSVVPQEYLERKMIDGKKKPTSEKHRQNLIAKMELISLAISWVCKSQTRPSTRGYEEKAPHLPTMTVTSLLAIVERPLPLPMRLKTKWSQSVEGI